MRAPKSVQLELDNFRKETLIEKYNNAFDESMRLEEQKRILTAMLADNENDLTIARAVCRLVDEELNNLTTPSYDREIRHGRNIKIFGYDAPVAPQVAKHIF